MSEVSIFGESNDGPVTRAVLRNEEVSLAILSLGAITQDWRVHGVPVVLGLNTLEDYLHHSPSFGIIAGRVANRIAQGRFHLDGTDYQLPLNDGLNHLHGGPGGLGHVNWSLEADQTRARLRYHSPDGEMGYPAAVDFEVEITLDGYDVTYAMRAVPDRRSPINLAQHNYYNLNGTGDVRSHVLWVDAQSYTEVDETLIPTGRQLPLGGSTVDFRKPCAIEAQDPARVGFDVNVALRADRDTSAPAAQLIGDHSGLSLKIWTQEPGVQLYNAPQLAMPVPGLTAKQYKPFSGICLEAQHFPDSPNQPSFAPIIYGSGMPYEQILRLRIAPSDSTRG